MGLNKYIKFFLSVSMKTYLNPLLDKVLSLFRSTRASAVYYNFSPHVQSHLSGQEICPTQFHFSSAILSTTTCSFVLFTISKFDP